MKNRTLLLIAILVIATTLLSAGIPREFNRSNEILPVDGKLTQSYPTLQKGINQLLPMGVLDTLIWVDGGNVNFGGWTDDYFAAYFVPAADGTLHSLTFNMSDLPDVSGGGMAVWIYEANYTWPEISTVDIADGPNSWLGYYDTADGPQAFGTEAEWHGGYIDSLEEAITGKIYDPLGKKVWPMFGAGNVALEPTPADKGFFTVNLIDLGSTYDFAMGDTFMVVVKFTGFEGTGDVTEHRIGFLSGKFDVEPQPGLKFYNVNSSPTGRRDIDDWGWYIRSYIWDWRANVEYTGDRGPVISDLTVLNTTISTAARTVTATITDDNPSGGSAGVASAAIMYSTDGGANYSSVSMTHSGDVFSGDIPGQAPGTEIYWYVQATDVEGLVTETIPKKYSIFEATSSFLFLYDASSHPYDFGYMYPYFYGYNCPSDSFMWDQWNGLGYGPATAELLANYEVIYWVGGFYPANVPNGQVFADWLATGTADNPKCLLVTGQDYGVISDFKDTTFSPGSFEYDYLGIAKLGPQDIIEGTTDIYPLDPVQDDIISGYMYQLMQDSSLQLVYDPSYLRGTNWIDNMEATDDATVFLTDPNNNDGPVGVRKEGAGFKAAYISVDPYCLNYADMSDSTVYYSNTDDILNIFDKFLVWFDASRLDVENEVTTVPKAFSLKQNYPNPFNPTTSITYSIPRNEFVRLTIYNMLGQKVRTLVSSRQVANEYRINWDGRDDNGLEVPSGVYFYNMEAGSYVSTKKMVLMK